MKRKMINKTIIFSMVMVTLFCLSGCYNNFDDPQPARIWTADDFPESQHISIKDFKQKFYDVYGNGAASLAKTLEITDDYLISGKVISSDRAGNVYKSVYIYDGTAAIELKLTVSNYVTYHVGQTIYVRLKGLAIGNYRYMLSVGVMPTDADITNGYANRNLETSVQINAHIFRGEKGELVSSDTLVITPSNYASLNDDVLGCLVRFENMTYKTGTFDGDEYPQYLETVYPNGSTTAVYTNKFYEDEGLPATYAYSYNGDSYYGSSWFSYGVSTPTVGNYIVRVSGYANFARQKLPQEGKQGDITAIYTKYSSRTGGYIKYQLLINSFDDIQF
jgi:hypothetical protein